MVRNKASAAAELRGPGPGGGGLEKLSITHDGQDYLKNGPIKALFNPQEISRTRSVSWQRKDAADKGGGGFWLETEQEFLAVEPARLSIELFFDTYEPRPQASDWKRAASLVQTGSKSRAGGAADVTKLTNRVAELAAVDKERHRPPFCKLFWGKFGVFFTGVLDQLDQRFTLFLTDGTPVRATLTCSFVELLTQAAVRKKEPNSADVVKTRVVHRNDTLHSLAAEEYRDPGLWRHIASANGIVNPRKLTPGTVLTIPKLVR